MVRFTVASIVPVTSTTTTRNKKSVAIDIAGLGSSILEVL